MVSFGQQNRFLAIAEGAVVGGLITLSSFQLPEIQINSQYLLVQTVLYISLLGLLPSIFLTAESNRSKVILEIAIIGLAFGTGGAVFLTQSLTVGIQLLVGTVGVGAIAYYTGVVSNVIPHTLLLFAFYVLIHLLAAFAFLYLLFGIVETGSFSMIFAILAVIGVFSGLNVAIRTEFSTRTSTS